MLITPPTEPPTSVLIYLSLVSICFVLIVVSSAVVDSSVVVDDSSVVGGSFVVVVVRSSVVVGSSVVVVGSSVVVKISVCVIFNVPSISCGKVTIVPPVTSAGSILFSANLMA